MAIFCLKSIKVLIILAPNVIKSRLKRSAVGFHRMIRCYQPVVNVLGSYGNYGCFCGFSGDGYPIDETDKYVVLCVPVSTHIENIGIFTGF